ncbi:MAG: OprO/OprP family phosphate-selective porin [Methylohalobius sp.]|nr:OprO/OprP family phosphate-selective porin [Methylohalobius sp.]
MKNPFGLYNETRDVAFTRPSIILPQGIYPDRNRALFLSSDGGQLFFENHADWGDLFFAFNVGLPRGPYEELKASVFGLDAPGQLQANRPMYLGQLRYEYNAGEWVFAVSYADAELEYNAKSRDPVALLAEFPFKSGIVSGRPLLFSAQYNGEKVCVTAEYLAQFNDVKNFGPGFAKTITSESWYIQGQYRINPQLQVTARYDVFYLDRSDRHGRHLGLEPFRPRHSAFAKDWMIGVRFDLTPNWMISAEYHRVNGTAWLPFKDNPNPNKNRAEWDIVLGLVSFRF